MSATTANLHGLWALLQRALMLHKRAAGQYAVFQRATLQRACTLCTLAPWEHQLAPMLHANFSSGVCFAPTTIECSGVPYSTPRCPRVAQTYPRLPCSTHPLPTADFVSFARAAAKSRHRITCWLGYRRGANPTASAPGLGSCLPPTSAPGSGSPLPHPGLGSPLPHPHRGTVLKQSITPLSLCAALRALHGASGRRSTRHNRCFRLPGFSGLSHHQLLEQ